MSRAFKQEWSIDSSSKRLEDIVENLNKSVTMFKASIRKCQSENSFNESVVYSTDYLLRSLVQIVDEVKFSCERKQDKQYLCLHVGCSESPIPYRLGVSPLEIAAQAAESKTDDFIKYQENLVTSINRYILRMDTSIREALESVWYDCVSDGYTVYVSQVLREYVHEYYVMWSVIVSKLCGK